MLARKANAVEEVAT